MAPPPPSKVAGGKRQREDAIAPTEDVDDDVPLVAVAVPAEQLLEFVLNVFRKLRDANNFELSLESKIKKSNNCVELFFKVCHTNRKSTQRALTRELRLRYEEL
jgi:hypothetical protein